MAKQTPKEKSEAKKDEENLQKNPINNFICVACKDHEACDYEEFKKHLLDVHGIDAKDKAQMKGTRQMIMHMDGSYWFSSTYNWTLVGGLQFSQYTKQARAKDDWMRHHD